jgi:hypothetical protein
VWKLQIVDRNKHIGSLHSSLALDSDGNPHISYEDNAVGNLVYASWNASAWNLRIVDQIRLAPGDLGVWGFPTSIALDATGTAHISYTGYTRHDLKYAAITDSPSFLVTFEQTGLKGYEGTVLEVDSIEYTTYDLPKLFVWRAGNNHSFTFVPAMDLDSGSKLQWASTSGLSTSRSGVLTVSKEGAISANYEETNSDSGMLPPSQGAFGGENIYLNFIIGSVIAAIAVVAVLLFFTKRKNKSLKRAGEKPA